MPLASYAHSDSITSVLIKWDHSRRIVKFKIVAPSYSSLHLHLIRPNYLVMIFSIFLLIIISWSLISFHFKFTLHYYQKMVLSRTIKSICIVWVLYQQNRTNYCITKWQEVFEKKTEILNEKSKNSNDKYSFCDIFSITFIIEIAMCVHQEANSGVN